MSTRLIFPEGYHYDCGAAAKCCHTEWNVFVDPTAYEKVCGSPLFERLKDQHGTDPMYMTTVDGNKACLALVKPGGCVFLDADNLCMIHRDMGIASKPLGCREFPFLPVPTPDGVVVGLSFYCDAVQKDQGRDVSEYAEVIEGFLREYRYTGVGFRPIPLTAKVAVSWEGYKLIEAMAQEDLATLPDLRAAMWHTFKKICVVSMLAERAVEGAPEQGPVVIEDDRLADILDLARVDHVARDEVFTALENMFLVGVLGVLEANERSERRQIHEAIEARETFTSGVFRQEVDLTRFDEFRLGFDPGDSEAPFRRYASMLLFRKLLALKRPIVANASLYYLSLGLLEWYRDLAAHVRGKSAPDAADIRTAFDVLERDLVEHARGLDAFFHEMARSYMGQLALVPGVFTGAPTAPPRTPGLYAD